MAFRRNPWLVDTDGFLDKKARCEGITYNDAFRYIKEADKFRRETLSTAITRKEDIIWDQTNLNFKYQFPKEYYKIAVIMPYVTWEHTQKVNKLRLGKTISHEVWSKFAIAYDEMVGKLFPTIDGYCAKGFDETIYAPSFEIKEERLCG